jgi:hypothetical protein
MTHRSPNPHQPKTTTISRRLRDRADQNLSVQPPEIPQIREARSHRAADVQTPRHNPIDYQTPGSHPLSLAWNTSHVLEDIPPNSTFHLLPSDQDSSLGPPFAQTSYSTHHESLQDSSSRPAHSVSPQTLRTPHSQPSRAPTFSPSPLTSVSGSHGSELQVPVDVGQSDDSFLELQDMRYIIPPTTKHGRVLMSTAPWAS